MPRLDRYLGAQLGIRRRDVQRMLAEGRVEVDGRRVMDTRHPVTRFCAVRCNGELLQAATPRYVMLNKPQGVVSATVDERHQTVIDLLDDAWKGELHIVGRLDFNSTGLMLLTNDGRWSRRLSLPGSRLLKRYRVTLENPITDDMRKGFREGIYFHYEQATTRPAELVALGEREAEVGLVEGRYHQIKRMFGRFDNKVLSIHRIAVGPLLLDSALAPGQSRELTKAELATLA